MGRIRSTRVSVVRLRFRKRPSIGYARTLATSNASRVFDWAEDTTVPQTAMKAQPKGSLEFPVDFPRAEASRARVRAC